MSDADPARSFRRRGLGRGLDALFAAEPERPEESPLISVDPAIVAPNPEQPRRSFDTDALAALGESIRLHGLLHPIVVQRDGPGFRLVAGERRLRAAQLAGVTTIPAIVRPAAESARHALEMALTENLMRTDLNPMEEAAAYARMADAFGLTHEAIAVRVSRNRVVITTSIGLLRLAAPVQEAIAALRLTAGHGRALLPLTSASDQEMIAEEVMARGLSVRETELLVKARLAAPTAPGSPGRQGTPRPHDGPLSPDDTALRHGLEQVLGARIRIVRRKGASGSIVIDFFDADDLDALYTRLGGAPL